MYPLPGTAPSDKVKALIGIASGIDHPFFVIENKGFRVRVSL